MYFDFEDLRPDTPTIERAISAREGLLLSLVLHLVWLTALLVLPHLPIVRQLEQARLRALEQAQLETLARQRESQRFVFVQPRVDLEALAPPPVAELSDKDRVARAPERAERPMNPLPFARGNSPERVEADQPEVARGEGPTPDPAAGVADGRGSARGADSSASRVLPPGDLTGLARPPARAGSGVGGPASEPGGLLGDALRNLDRYIQRESFDNQTGGGGEFGSSIQFDTKGVEFGPWIRRFVAQIKRNWFIPYAAIALKGHVVLTFWVHKDGGITELTVLQPSAVEAFTNASYNALVASDPTQPLPPEYPADRAFFTVTFYYNEAPPGG